MGEDEYIFLLVAVQTGDTTVEINAKAPQKVDPHWIYHVTELSLCLAYTQGPLQPTLEMPSHPCSLLLCS